MMNRTAAAGLLLLLGSPALAGEAKSALRDAQFLSNGGQTLSAGYDGCPGGVCSLDETDPVQGCPDGKCRIDKAVDGATKRGGLTVAKSTPRPAMKAVVPAPKLTADKEGAKSKKSGGIGEFFGDLFSGKGIMYGLGGAAAGAGAGFLIGGPIGAIIGGLIGAIGGLLLAKFL